jgi:branched-chain amino acid transport system substrate-binding protein
LIDTGGPTAQVLDKVRAAIEQSAVRFFTGAASPETAPLIADQLAQAGCVYACGLGVDELAGAPCHRSVFRWSSSPHAAVAATIDPLVALLPNAERWFVVAPQTALGLALQTPAEDRMRALAVDQVGSARIAPADREFFGLFQRILTTRPDMVVLLATGAQSSALLRHAVNIGAHRKTGLVTVWSGGLHQLQSLGPDTIDSLYFGSQYWHEAATSANRFLIAHTRARYGINPNAPLAAEFIGTKLLIDAIAATGSSGPEEVIAALEGLDYEGPTGPESIGARDHQCHKAYYLLRGKSRRNMRDADNLADIINTARPAPVSNAPACRTA